MLDITSPYIAMPLDTDLLRTFIAVCDAGHFTGAAARLGRTQSAVSMQMQRLEESVGKQLFTRNPRGVTLTSGGETLMPYARRIMMLLEETTAALNLPRLEGKVRIGVPEEYGQPVLARALSAFASTHPNVEITMHHARSADQVAALDAGELDLAVVFEWEEFSEGVTLIADPTVWTVSQLHPVHEEVPLPIALYDDAGWGRQSAIDWLRRHQVDYRIACQSRTTGGLKLAVTAGIAIAPISRSNIPPGCRELTAAEGFGRIDASRLVLRKRQHSSTKAVDGMARAIREAFQGDITAIQS
jgi:DNA-binding transcriptional LysR family regulator